MMNFLGVTHHGQQRKGGFDQHPVIPGSLLTDFDVVRHTLGTAEAPVSQHDRFLVIFFEEIQKVLVGTVHFVPNPTANLTETVENPTQLDPDTPASFVAALGPKLL